MINFLDNENTLNLICLEKTSLTATLSIQKTLNRQILMFLKSFIGSIKISFDFDPSNKSFHYLNSSTLILNRSNSNIDSIKKLISELDGLESSYSEISSDELKQSIEKYNSDFTEKINVVFENTKDIEKFIHEISLIDLNELLKDFSTDSNEELPASQIPDKELTSTTISSTDLSSAFVENTLIISEIQGKVILPYKIDTLRTILLTNDDKYSSIEDIINKLYTKPISDYRFSAISRAKEAYSLVLNKEKGSKLKALSLAFELFANYNLHPAVITACDSLDKLDIYLACLEDNILAEFKFFDVKYEVLPTISKVRDFSIEDNM